MNYITILEPYDYEFPNVGTITSEDAESKFKEAVESHFDATMVSYEFAEPHIIKNLTDCINSSPIEVLVEMDFGGRIFEKTVQLSQTWLY